MGPERHPTRLSVSSAMPGICHVVAGLITAPPGTFSRFLTDHFRCLLGANVKLTSSPLLDLPAASHTERSVCCIKLVCEHQLFQCHHWSGLALSIEKIDIG